jgi:hypothetical protein
MMAPISAVVICYNEARRIGQCLQSLAWANEVVVVDSGSTDGTQEVCQKHTDKVFYVPFVNFPRQRNAAMALASFDWIFFLDADEEVEGPLREELLALTLNLSDGGPAAWSAPRRNIIWGAWVQGGGWYPDYQVRLLDRRRCRYDETRAVHEVVQVEGDKGYLQRDLLHHNYQSLGQFLEKQDRYANLYAKTLHDIGVQPRFRSLLGQPLREFIRRYITTGGWRDGWRGLALAGLLAYYQWLAYWRLRRIQPTRRT